MWYRVFLRYNGRNQCAVGNYVGTSRVIRGVVIACKFADSPACDLVRRVIFISQRGKDIYLAVSRPLSS